MFTYASVLGMADRPVNFISFYDAIRFANWMQNGQGDADTETGAYTITPLGIATNSIERNASATVFLPSEDEWYKAAYFDSASVSYLDYPTGSSLPTLCSASPVANSANCGNAHLGLTDAGAYQDAPSPYGTFDQGGNVSEVNETLNGSLGERGLRGGEFSSAASELAAAQRSRIGPTLEFEGMGFRLATSEAPAVPEPGAGVLLLVGATLLLGAPPRR